ncbi:MAG: hypothetical protein VZQ55_07680 [Ruminococcus sp.]|nr:hypothetical protein [Ruminococcus sp.]
MKYRVTSILLSIVLAVGTLFSVPVTAAAEENLWSVSNLILEHTSVSFKLAGVDHAQDAKICIELNEETDRYGDGVLRNTDASSYIEVPFVINNTYQNFDLEFLDNKYLESEHSYQIIIKNENDETVYNSINDEYKIYSIHSHDHNIGYRSAYSVFEPEGALIYDDSNISECASTTLGFKTYKGEKIKDNYIKIEYPKQEIGTEIEFTLSDGYGCERKYTAEIQKEFSDDDFEIENEDILLTSAKVKCTDYIRQKIRLCAEINGEVYYGDFTEDIDLSVNYPETAPGTEVILWVEGELGSKTEPKSYSVYSKTANINIESVSLKQLKAYVYDYSISSAYIIIGDERIDGTREDRYTYTFNYSVLPGQKITVYFVDDDGYIFSKETAAPTKHDYYEFNVKKCNVDKTIVEFCCYNEGDFDEDDYNENNVKSISLIANGKTYKLKGGYDEDNENLYKVEYSIKKNTKAVIKVITTDGYTYTKNVTVKAVTPNISLWNFYAGDTDFYGRTKAGASVNIKIGKKKYSTKADDDGYFHKKVKAQKYKTKINVSVKTKTNCTNSKSAKVKALWGSIILKTTIYKTTSKVKVKVTSVRKNDKVKLKIGKKTYTKKVKKKRGSTTITFKIKKSYAGSKIKIKYTDKFGKPKAYYTGDQEIVYIGDNIYNGMSEKDCVLTSWGYPFIRNNYSGMKLWKFERGSSILWVYIQNGRVKTTEHINY